MKYTLYSFKWPLSLVLIGLVTRTLASMMKVMHWRGADAGLLAGTILVTAGLWWLLMKLISVKKLSS